MQIAVLALQGAFIEHEQILSRLGVDTFEIRQRMDLEKNFDGLIIPGGESTVQVKLLRELGLMQPIRDEIAGGLPVFGTCAGLILLARSVKGEDVERIGTMDIDVCRNAYGRQLGSFYTESRVEGVGDDVPMTFIRAPYINSVSGNAKAIAVVDGHIVAACQGRQLVTAFHPELNDDMRMHSHFVELIRKG